MTTCMTIFSVLLVIGLAASQYHSLLSSNLQSEESSQENSDERHQSVDAEGNVQGSYSYVNALGKITNVRYIAGNDGFRIIGEHIPVPSSSYQPLFKNSEPSSKRTRYPSVQDLQAHPSRDNYQEYQPRLTEALFIPSPQPYPAHTAGQTKSMQDYFEEERRDLEKEKREMRRAQAQSHVSVSGPNQAYSYEVNY